MNIESYREIELTLSKMFNNHVAKEEITLIEVIEQIKQYQQWILDLKQEFKIKKNSSLEHIANQIFSKNAMNKNMCKMHIMAIEIVVSDICDDLRRQDANWDMNNHYIKGKLALLNDVILDINELIWKCKEAFLDEPQTRKSGRRRLFDSGEIFFSSKNLLKRHFHYNDISFSSISVFLIRQSIEIKILNCLGIYSIVDKNEVPKKFKLEDILSFIEKTQSIKFPLKKSLLLKIVKWSNSYVHRGVMHFHWEIVLAHKVLQPLFSMDEGKTMISLHGAVKIEKEYFNNKLYGDLLNHLEFNQEDTVIKTLTSPEAIIE